LATLAVITIEPFNDQIPTITEAQDTDLLSTDMNNKIGYGELSEAREQSKITNKDLDMQWIVIAGALTY